MAAAGRVAILSSSIKKGEKRGGGVQKQFGGARLGRAARHTRGAVVVVGAPLCLFPPCGKSEGLAAAPLARAIAARQKGWEQHNTHTGEERGVDSRGGRRRKGANYRREEKRHRHQGKGPFGRADGGVWGSIQANEMGDSGGGEITPQTDHQRQKKKGQGKNFASHAARVRAHTCAGAPSQRGGGGVCFDSLGRAEEGRNGEREGGWGPCISAIARCRARGVWGRVSAAAPIAARPPAARACFCPERGQKLARRRAGRESERATGAPAG